MNKVGAGLFDKAALIRDINAIEITKSNLLFRRNSQTGAIEL